MAEIPLADLFGENVALDVPDPVGYAFFENHNIDPDTDHVKWSHAPTPFYTESDYENG